MVVVIAMVVVVVGELAKLKDGGVIGTGLGRLSGRSSPTKTQGREERREKKKTHYFSLAQTICRNR